MNPYENVNPKSKYQWHCYWVFEDPEFQQDVTAYVDAIKRLQKLRHQSNDPNSLSWTKKVGDLMLNQRDAICRKYVISSTDFLIYKTKNEKFPLYKMEGLFYTIVDVKVSEIDGNVAVRFKPNISKEEYIKAWVEIKRFIDDEVGKGVFVVKPTKRKQEVDYRLIYAISRARYKRMSFPDIHKLYEQGKLPNYKSSTNKRFDTPKALNDYYLKNSTFKQ